MTGTTEESISNVSKNQDTYLFQYPCKLNNICEPYVINFPKGSYQIELWGSSGGNGRIKNLDTIREDSGGHGTYVSGNIQIQNSIIMFLYLGGQGHDQEDITHNRVPASGGWNFGGKGGIDFNDNNEYGEYFSLESGAGGGGAVDLRLEYADLNNIVINSNIFNKSIKSRIIVAGSGGGACSGSDGFGIPNGFPGGNSSALPNGPYTFGGTQTEGQLGIGMNGISGRHNEGGSGGCGSGYRGGFSNFPSSGGNSNFEVGGTGGSSYIKTKDETNQFLVDYSDLFFTNNIMISGSENMPSPYNNSYITGHVGHGVCRITILHLYMQCSCFCRYNINICALFISSSLS